MREREVLRKTEVSNDKGERFQIREKKGFEREREASRARQDGERGGISCSVREREVGKVLTWLSPIGLLLIEADGSSC